jgi:hypothetical protein
LQTDFRGGNGTDGDAYKLWLTDVLDILPGAGANPPTVTISATGQVSIAIHWNLPGDTPHNYLVVAQIN